MPLTDEHPQAMAAAVAGEEARAAGRFAAVHDALFALGCRLDQRRISRILAQNGVPHSPARAALAHAVVNRDMADARRLGIDATPSLFFVSAGGRVWRIRDLSAVKSLMGGTAGRRPAGR